MRNSRRTGWNGRAEGIDARGWGEVTGGGEFQDSRFKFEAGWAGSFQMPVARSQSDKDAAWRLGKGSFPFAVSTLTPEA
jgi:hypothetical protein